MSEYVSRDDARRVVCNMCRWEDTSNCEECEHPIDDIPAADLIEQKCGVWEERIEEDKKHDPYGLFNRRFYCSACGHWQTHGKTKYCHNCGAKMERS